ncbi:hypothetical protein ES288_1Z001800v1 [Gossypium darwinii]|uniref:Uncharacterized protein n=1 Tax=Gossypium darwinii TaxID=34276 RepID=A0A5C7J025_GOSDA|nr:hypothetical protein ES288_1Z001800v1 [Gossypium darwinii]
MGIIEKRKTNLLLASTVIIFLLKINHCGTAFIVKSNTSYNCNSRLDECRAVETFNSELVWELDMVMNSNFVRILASGGGKEPVTRETLISRGKNLARTLNMLVVLLSEVKKQTVGEHSTVGVAETTSVYYFCNDLCPL